MNTSQPMKLDGEFPVFEAVKSLRIEDVESTVKHNAARMGFVLSDEHLHVIRTLIKHYQTDCANRDCLAAHEHMRYLEETYQDQGGSRYLYTLFDAVPETRGVLAPIHALAGLPALRMETDEGFGTAY